MGIQDRDYYREESNSFLNSWGRHGAVVWLIVITSALFFIQMMTGPKSELHELGKYSYDKVLSGEVWRLLTPLFLHANIWHLILNMFVLYWAGTRLVEIYRPREIVFFYLTAGIFAQLAHLVAHVAQLALPFHAIGASGAVAAVLVSFAVHYPRQKVMLFFVLPVPAWMLVILFIAADSLSSLGAERNEIGYIIVDLGGVLFGFLYYRIGASLRASQVRMPRTVEQRSRPVLRLLDEELEEERAEPVGAVVEAQYHTKEATDEHLEAKLDRVLEKLSQHGQESLTNEEREILVKASEVYKKRRK